MHRMTKLVTALGALAIIAGACGGGASPTPAPGTAQPSSSAPATETATPAASEATFPTGDFKLLLWTKEGEGSGGFQYVKKLTTGFSTLHPNVTIEVVNKDVEALREDFQTASLAGAAPQLLWTVADHVGPFTAADLILPLDDMIDKASYVPAAANIVTADGKLWGAPTSFGNQLMLYWNKSLAGDTVPADSDALIAKAKETGTLGLVFPQNESFWLVPFLGGFGGTVFAADGVTPTLDTDAMKGALKFMYDLKYTDKIMPKEADAPTSESLFKGGTVAFTISGDWNLGSFSEALGDKLGVGPLPMITGHEDPKPYIAGTFLMASKGVGDDPNLKTVVSEFMKYATAPEQQIDMVKTLKRLPGNAAAIADAVVTGDPLLSGAAAAAQKGVPQPTNLEMRCIFDSMNTGVRDMFTGKATDFAVISKAMQTSAEACIAKL